METVAETVPAPQKKKSKVPLIILAVVIAIGGFFGIRILLHSMHYTSTDNAQVETNSIPVLSRINGYIDSVLVSDYQEVKKGDLLFVIDRRELEISLHQAEADLLSAKADLLNAEAMRNNSIQNKSVFSAGSDVQQVRVTKAKADFDRDQLLYKDGAITQKQLEDSRTNYDASVKLYASNVEQTKLAQTQTATTEAQVIKAGAMIRLREAMVEQAKLRLSYAMVYAPATGRVNKVSLQPGQYIQPGQNLLSIIDNTRFWIVANFKETQIARLQVGQEVDIRIDGYKGKKVKGQIASFSDATGAKFALLPPDNASGNFVKVTQRIPVKVEFSDIESIRPFLKAGMSVEVDVKID